MPRNRLFCLVVAVAMSAAPLAACSGGSGGDSASSKPALTTTPSINSPPTNVPKCKLPKRIAYPDWVPKDLPLPDGIYASQRLPQTAGYSRGLFVIPQSTTDFAKFVLRVWPKSGWTLGRGDAEPGEVEDQFVKGQAFGAFKAQDMLCQDPHSIMLLIYVPDRTKLPGISTQGGSPLPGNTQSPSPSPSPSPS